MTSTDIEIIPDEQSFSDPSSHGISRTKSDTHRNLQESKSHSTELDNPTASHKISMIGKSRRVGDVSVAHKIRIAKYITCLLVDCKSRLYSLGQNMSPHYHFPSNS